MLTSLRGRAMVNVTGFPPDEARATTFSTTVVPALITPSVTSPTRFSALFKDLPMTVMAFPWVAVFGLRSSLAEVTAGKSLAALADQRPELL
ncbi:MAG: hypothetical protein WB777_02375 [Mycobacterium sp.]